MRSIPKGHRGRVSLLAALLLASAPWLARAESSAPPTTLFADIESGPTTGGPNNRGVPITVFGSGFGSARGTSTVTIGGIEVASYLVWGTHNALNPTLDMLVVQPGPNVTGGAIRVIVGGQASRGNLVFTPNTGHLRYVSVAGSDSADCSEFAPCATLTHTIESSVSSPGDTILVRGGTLTESEIWVRREYGHGGTLGQQKTIKVYPGESATFVNGDRPFYVDADYVTVDGFRFQNGKSIGVPDAGDTNRRRGARLINNAVVGPVAWSFIDTHGDDHLIAGNVCAATSSVVGTQGHCFYISYGNGVKVIYNIGSGAPGYGIHVFDQLRTRLPQDDFKRVISNLLLEGNILKSSKERAGLILAMRDEGSLGNVIDQVIVRNNILTGNNHLGMTLSGNVRNVKIYHNTFEENGRQSLYIGAGTLLANIDVRNNLFVQSPNSVCQIDCSWYSVAHLQIDAAAASKVLIRNNGYFPGAPTLLGATDPAAVTGAMSFANPAGLDFRVLPGGSSIDRGETLADVPNDFAGLPRPSGAAYDLGAFESRVNVAQPLAPPRQVRISR